MSKRNFFNGSLTALVLLVAGLMLLGCRKGEVKPTAFYQAVNGRDTAFLSLNFNEGTFYGNYIIRRHNFGSDIGSVRGKVKGDTLVGDYFYRPDGHRDKKRVPLALLKKDGKLVIGTGVAMEYLQIPYYSPEAGISFSNPEFVFSRVKDSIAPVQ